MRLSQFQKLLVSKLVSRWYVLKLNKIVLYLKEKTERIIISYCLLFPKHSKLKLVPLWNHWNNGASTWIYGSIQKRKAMEKGVYTAIPYWNARHRCSTILNRNWCYYWVYWLKIYTFKIQASHDPVDTGWIKWYVNNEDFQNTSGIQVRNSTKENKCSEFFDVSTMFIHSIFSFTVPDQHPNPYYIVAYIRRHHILNRSVCFVTFCPSRTEMDVCSVWYLHCDIKMENKVIKRYVCFVRDIFLFWNTLTLKKRRYTVRREVSIAQIWRICSNLLWC